MPPKMRGKEQGGEGGAPPPSAGGPKWIGLNPNAAPPRFEPVASLLPSLKALEVRP